MYNFLKTMEGKEKEKKMKEKMLQVLVFALFILSISCGYVPIYRAIPRT